MNAGTQREREFDYVLVGGGLQNSLIALALLESRPALRLALVEREAGLGGEHTWCFHADDVPAAARPFVEPLIERRWDGYEVAFPSGRRTLGSPYAGLSSRHLDATVRERLAGRAGCALLCGATATAVDEHRVQLADGTALEGVVVVDARGPAVDAARGRAGFQKFVGRELLLRRPHGLDRPIVMDATVPQHDGFRFFYLLPLGPRLLLVEDTRFADGPELDRPGLRAEIDAYAAGMGLDVEAVVREEEGVLPMPWTGAVPVPSRGPLIAGYRGGWMHPATGYSFPVAVRLAALIAATPTAELFGPALAALAREVDQQARFGQRLNSLLFHWFLPSDRRAVFERFYRLPEPTIRRFYALRTTAPDRLRILVGRPPRGLSVRARLTASERLHEPAPS